MKADPENCMVLAKVTHDTGVGSGSEVGTESFDQGHDWGEICIFEHSLVPTWRTGWNRPSRRWEDHQKRFPGHPLPLGIMGMAL